jgi:hypothetical protein
MKAKHFERRGIRAKIKVRELEKLNMNVIKSLSCLLARNLALEDILWAEILVSIRDVDARTELLRQRNTIVKDIHTEFRALNIQVPTVAEKNSEDFASFLGELSDDDKKKPNLKGLLTGKGGIDSRGLEEIFKKL